LIFIQISVYSIFALLPIQGLQAADIFIHFWLKIFEASNKFLPLTLFY